MSSVISLQERMWNQPGPTPPSSTFSNWTPESMGRNLNMGSYRSTENSRETGRTPGSWQRLGNLNASTNQYSSPTITLSSVSNKTISPQRHWKELFGSSGDPREQENPEELGERPPSMHTLKIRGKFLFFFFFLFLIS